MKTGKDKQGRFFAECYSEEREEPVCCYSMKSEDEAIKKTSEYFKEHGLTPHKTKNKEILEKQNAYNKKRADIAASKDRPEQDAPGPQELQEKN